MTPDVTEHGPVRLSEEEAAAVGDVVAAYARAVPPDRAEPYLDLLDALASGTVSDANVAALQQVCALALETGQARRVGLAEVETLVANVYRRTPDGRARVAEVRGVNEALSQLAGRPLRAAKVSWTRPGRYTLTLQVSGFDLTLAITPNGLEVQSLATS